MKAIIRLIKDYNLVILVSVYFALTSIYYSDGKSNSVAWVTYIKTVRELFLIGLISIILTKYKNILTSLIGLSAIGVSFYLCLFRWYSAYVSDGDYKIYRTLMSDHKQSLMLIAFIFIIFVTANYINKK